MSSGAGGLDGLHQQCGRLHAAIASGRAAAFRRTVGVAKFISVVARKSPTDNGCVRSGRRPAPLPEPCPRASPKPSSRRCDLALPRASSRTRPRRGCPPPLPPSSRRRRAPGPRSPASAERINERSRKTVGHDEAEGDKRECGHRCNQPPRCRCAHPSPVLCGVR